jgi:hypothetical protein
MRYSLLSRFQGAFLGRFFGELLASNWQENNSTLSKFRNLEDDLIQNLINTGKIQPILSNQLNPLNLEQNLSVAALISLPIILYNHESLDWLQENLQQFSDEARLSPSTQANLLLWGQAIALILREKLEIKQFIPQILSINTAVNPSLGSQLEQVQHFLTKGATLEKIVAQLTNSESQQETALALAFYCFGSTPEDFRLSLQLATRIKRQTVVISALTGILAGVYNSYQSIPISWRVYLQTEPRLKIKYHKIEQLWAVWSGVFGICHRDELKSEALAAPAVIQSRSSLRIISQRE